MASDPGVLHQFDGRLYKLLRLIHGGSGYGDVAAEVQRILRQYESDSCTPTALFQVGWEQHWRDGYVADGWLLDPLRENPDSRLQDALRTVADALMRFVLDSPAPHLQETNGQRLDGALCNYLARRGYDVGLKARGQSEGIDGAGSAATKARKTKRGRKRLSREETQRRMDVLSAWEQARNAGTAMKTFCRERKPSLSVKELERIVAWKATRNRRKAGS